MFITVRPGPVKGLFPLEGMKKRRDNEFFGPEIQRLIREIRKIEAETEALKEEAGKLKGKEPTEKK